MKPQYKNEIIVPPDTLRDKSAIEYVRVWASGGKQHAVLQTKMFADWNDPIAWGLMLVDLVRHATRAYEEEKGHKPSAVLARIKEGIDSEWNEQDSVGRIYLEQCDKALPVPSEVHKDERAFELMRLWAGSKQYVTLRGTMWDDPYMWGYALTDLAKNVANGYAQGKVGTVPQVLARMKQGFDMDWKQTDKTSGQLI